MRGVAGAGAAGIENDGACATAGAMGAGAAWGGVLAALTVS